MDLVPIMLSNISQRHILHEFHLYVESKKVKGVKKKKNPNSKMVVTRGEGSRDKSAMVFKGISWLRSSKPET